MHLLSVCRISYNHLMPFYFPYLETRIKHVVFALMTGNLFSGSTTDKDIAHIFSCETFLFSFFYGFHFLRHIILNKRFCGFVYCCNGTCNSWADSVAVGSLIISIFSKTCTLKKHYYIYIASLLRNWINSVKKDWLIFLN